MSKKQDQSVSLVPQHVAIIMDGNRRWAKKQGLAALMGHSFVSNNVLEPLVDHCIELGIKYLTLWAFSTENWQRDTAEVQGLMSLFREALLRNTQRLFEKGVRLQAIGDLGHFPKDIQEGIAALTAKSAKNDAITVTFALNYGGRDEIVRAVNKILEEACAGAVPKAPRLPITEEMFAQYLDTKNMPDPDLLIRPGGEQRLSGFLPWQTVYTELYFSDILMPDFSPADLDAAVAEYARRQRRFGK